MKLFIGTKLIAAMAMTRAAYNEFRGWTLPADENGQDEGYLVEYLDGGRPNVPSHAGYVSWSPKEQFEKAYHPCHEMTFGLALEALKRGDTVARIGWNGHGMFVYMVPANSYPAQTGAAKEHFGADALVPYYAYLALVDVAGGVCTWTPDQVAWIESRDDTAYLASSAANMAHLQASIAQSQNFAGGGGAFDGGGASGDYGSSASSCDSSSSSSDSGSSSSSDSGGSCGSSD